MNKTVRHYLILDFNFLIFIITVFSEPIFIAEMILVNNNLSGDKIMKSGETFIGITRLI